MGKKKLTIPNSKPSRPKEAIEPTSVFTTGYGLVSKAMSKSAKFVRSCYNCDHYFQALGDDGEMCQNSGVLQYDMVIDERRIYCSQWKPVVSKEVPSAKDIFRRNLNK